MKLRGNSQVFPERLPSGLLHCSSFIYSGCTRVFVAAHGLPLVAATGATAGCGVCLLGVAAASLQQSPVLGRGLRRGGRSPAEPGS